MADGALLRELYPPEKKGVTWEHKVFTCADCGVDVESGPFPIDDNKPRYCYGCKENGQQEMF